MRRSRRTMPGMILASLLRRRTPPGGGWSLAILLGPPALVLVLALTVPWAMRDRAADADSAAATPQRIITIAPNSAEIICALGARDRIAGVSKFCVFPPELASLPRVGGLFDPDLERIASLRPDLLVLRGRSETLQALCRRNNILVYHDETDTLAGVEKCITELGEHLGLNAKAESLKAEFRGRLDRIKKRTSTLAKPRVFLTVSRQPNRLANLLTSGRGTFLDEMLEYAGGVNIFGDLDMRYPQVSAEAIIAKRPDVIIELMPEVEITPELRSGLIDQWRVFGTVPAVASERIYFLTTDHCLIPSPRYVEIIDQVSRLLHPELTVAP